MGVHQQKGTKDGEGGDGNTQSGDGSANVSGEQPCVSAQKQEHGQSHPDSKETSSHGHPPPTVMHNYYYGPMHHVQYNTMYHYGGGFYPDYRQ